MVNKDIKWDGRFSVHMDDEQCLIIKERMDRASGAYTQMIVDAREKFVRDHLIALGWTPPEGSEQINEEN